MEGAGLTLHPEKTQVVDLIGSGSHFDFLGYRFWRNREGGIARYVRPKSKRKLRARIKELTKRANGHSMEAIVAKPNPILRGWCGYFKPAKASALGEAKVLTGNPDAGEPHVRFGGTGGKSCSRSYPNQ
jgi:hypothetical protein